MRVVIKLILLFFCLIIVVESIEKYDSLENALKDYPQQDKRHGKKPKYVFFTLKQAHARQMDYFSKVLYQFMLTMGVRPYFVNFKDSVLLGIVPIDAEIDTEAILSQFTDVIEKIEIKKEMEAYK